MGPDHYPIDHSDLAERIYQVLRDEILCGKLQPGQRLSLDEFAQYFHVSVTPVRDALRLLASEGLVELRQRRGAFVTMPSAQAVRDVFQIRELLECSAVDFLLEQGGRACAEMQDLLDEIAAATTGESYTDYLSYIHLDQRFHQYMIDCLGNERLSELYSSLGSFTLVTLILHSSGTHRARPTLDEHRAIMAALQAGDAQAARSAIRAHLRNAGSELLRRLEDPGDAAAPDETGGGSPQPLW